jgi:hypothetical protein
MKILFQITCYSGYYRITITVHINSYSFDTAHVLASVLKLSMNYYSPHHDALENFKVFVRHLISVIKRVY